MQTKINLAPCIKCGKPPVKAVSDRDPMSHVKYYRYCMCKKDGTNNVSAYCFTPEDADKDWNLKNRLVTYEEVVRCSSYDIWALAGWLAKVVNGEVSPAAMRRDFVETILQDEADNER